MWAFQPGDGRGARADAAPDGGATALERPIRCASCLSAIASEDARIEVGGAHAHRFVNPAGYEYDIVCLREAPGCTVEGAPTEEHTWFAGFAWSFANCAACKLHLGWCYDGGARFFGLISGRLVAGA